MADPDVPLLSAQERVSIRHHMGYPQMKQVATFSLGTPANIQTDFLVERAMDLANSTGGVVRIRQYLCTLDKIECSMVDGMGDYDIARFDTVEVNPQAQTQKERLYYYWLNHLSDALAIPPNPLRFSAFGGNGINVGVRG